MQIDRKLTGVSAAPTNLVRYWVLIPRFFHPIPPTPFPSKLGKGERFRGEGGIAILSLTQHRNILIPPSSYPSLVHWRA